MEETLEETLEDTLAMEETLEGILERVKQAAASPSLCGDFARNQAEGLRAAPQASLVSVLTM